MKRLCRLWVMVGAVAWASSTAAAWAAPPETAADGLAGTVAALATALDKTLFTCGEGNRTRKSGWNFKLVRDEPVRGVVDGDGARLVLPAVMFQAGDFHGWVSLAAVTATLVPRADGGFDFSAELPPRIPLLSDGWHPRREIAAGRIQASGILRPGQTPLSRLAITFDGLSLSKAASGAGPAEVITANRLVLTLGPGADVAEAGRQAAVLGIEVEDLSLPKSDANPPMPPTVSFWLEFGNRPAPSPAGGAATTAREGWIILDLPESVGKEILLRPPIILERIEFRSVPEAATGERRAGSWKSKG